MEELNDINTDRLARLTQLIRLTADNLINKEVDGILKKPKSSAELERFNDNITMLIVNRLRQNFGV